VGSSRLRRGRTVGWRRCARKRNTRPRERGPGLAAGLLPTHKRLDPANIGNHVQGGGCPSVWRGRKKDPRREGGASLLNEPPSPVRKENPADYTTRLPGEESRRTSSTTKEKEGELIGPLRRAADEYATMTRIGSARSGIPLQ